MIAKMLADRASPSPGRRTIIRVLLPAWLHQLPIRTERGLLCAKCYVSVPGSGSAACGRTSVIQEAMTIREHAGRVDEVTWSKVQATSATIARTQAYALRQLDALAEKMERKTKISDIAKVAKEAESKVQGWLVVLARCFQLQDAIAVLELDRVLDAAPEDLDGHRLGLKASRQKRLDTISRSTGHLMARVDAAAGTANTKVLLHPATSAAVVQSRAHVASAVADFNGRLGIESGRRGGEDEQG